MLMILIGVTSLVLQPSSAERPDAAHARGAEHSGPCTTVSSEPVILRVQASESFSRVLSIVGGASPRGNLSQAEVDEICDGLMSASPSILGGVSLVWGVALHGIVDVQVMFGVHGADVLFLKSSSRLDYGIDHAAWNRLIGLNPTWHPGPGVRLLEYACLLVSLMRDRGVDATCPDEKSFSIATSGDAGDLEVQLERTGATVVLEPSGAIRSANVWRPGLDRAP